MPRMCSTPERASQHNAESLCAVGRRIGTAHRGSNRPAPAANCSPLSRPHNLHYVEMPAARGCAPRGRRCAGSSIAKADKKYQQSHLPRLRCDRFYPLAASTAPSLCQSPISACLRLRDAGHSLYAEKRTSGSAPIRRNRLRENPRLSDDGIRGNPPLRYDDASDAGVGAKSANK
jgi:hypothetical protein